MAWIEFSPMTFWLHYNPFQKKKIASRSHMEQGILSGKLSRGCPWDKWHGADAAAMWLQGKWARSYSPVAGAPSLCSAALLSPLGRDALLLWGHKEHTGSSPLKAPLPLSTVCIFLREKGQKTLPREGVSWSLLQVFSMYFLQNKIQIKLDFSSVFGRKAIPRGREK